MNFNGEPPQKWLVDINPHRILMSAKGSLKKSFPYSLGFLPETRQTGPQFSIATPRGLAVTCGGGLAVSAIGETFPPAVCCSAKQLVS